MDKVDTKLPVRFYDDRGKTKEILHMAKILFEDDEVCLCHTAFEPYKTSTSCILFRKDTGEVLTTNLEFWIATNGN